MRRVLTVLVGLTLTTANAQAQVKQSPRGVDFDCPITTYQGQGGVPDKMFVDFYACDQNGANCAASPEFTSPTGGLPVADTRLGHLPDGATCEINFQNIPYPVGKVYVVKGRWTNSAGSSPASSASESFTTPQPAPATPAHWKVVP